MERIEFCANDSTLDVILKNVTLTFNQNVLRLGGTFLIQKTVCGPMEFDILLIRCKSINNDCQTFLNNTYGQMCDVLYETRFFGGNFIKRITPQIKCPLLQGTYKMNNAEINLDFLSALPIDGFFWNVIATFYTTENNQERRMFACISGHVRVLQSGSKRRKTRN